MRSAPRPEEGSRASIAIRDGRIALIGSAEAAAAAVTGARAVDVGGSLVLPGFIDTHTHLGWAGEGLWRVALEDVRDRAAALERVRTVAARIEPDLWILGGGWDRDRLSDPELPSRADLDAVAGETPVYLVSEDRGAAVASSRALALFKIDDRTIDPPDGRIERDGRGRPTGRLFGPVVRARMTAGVAPPPDRYRRCAELRAAIRELGRHGVTEVHDIASYPDEGPTPAVFRERGFTDASLYDDLAARGELTIRVSIRPYLGRWADAARWAGRGDAPVRCHGVKMIIDDGRWSEGTAGPYEFRYPGYDTTLEWMRAADRAGLDVTLHGLGDAAVTEALDLFEAIASTEPARPRRQRLAHARRIATGDIERIAALGVIVEAQPWDLIEQMPAMSRRFSPEFLATAYPFASLLAAGARVAFGSDWRILPQRADLFDMDPLRAMAAAVTRTAVAGSEPWQPAQRIGAADAIRCYADHAAWADRGDDRRGTLRVGNDADLVVLSDDIVGDPDALARATVRMTVVGGEVVFDAGLR